MSPQVSYPAREAAIVAVPGESGLRLRRRGSDRELVLNPTAVLIWHACDGQRPVDDIAELLRLEWPDYSWPESEVTRTVDGLVQDGIVRLSDNPCEGSRIVRTGFHGMWPGFDPHNNYFLWVLSRRAAVIVTDPRVSDVDILCFAASTPDETVMPSSGNTDCIRILVDWGAEAEAEFDYAFDLSGTTLGPTDNGCALPPWVDAIDWWGHERDGTKLAARVLFEERKYRDEPVRDAWAELNGGTNNAFDALRETLIAKHGQPRGLLEPAGIDAGRNAPAIDRGTAASSSFVLIGATPAHPALAGQAVLECLVAGTVPLYRGEERLVAGINERAWINSGHYASTVQVAAVADMITRDTAYRERLLAVPVFYGNRIPEAIAPDTVGDAFWREMLGEAAASKPSRRAQRSRPGRKRLCIAMATYDDYDGVYFSIQAVRVYHPEVLDEVEFLIVDNNPDGPCGEALRGFASGIGDVHYVAHDGGSGTALAKNRAFIEAGNEYILCMDSHVLVVPGALRRLLDYYEAHPECRDLLQGPLLWDHMQSVATHFDPVWRGGMWGTWSSDERGRDPEAEPFEIPMQGMGLFTCRRAAWPGFHPDFRGFGSEEGYIHEKFRQAGGRTLCLPFLRWMHRFGRPLGPPYKSVWEDRIRNYFLGFRELDLDTAEMEAHFADHVNPEVVERTRRAVARELEGPFARFDAVYAIDLNADREQWIRRITRLKDLGLAKRTRYQPAPPEAGGNGLGFALALREILEDARLQGFETIAVIDSEAIFHADAASRLAPVVERLDDAAWEAVDIGPAWPRQELDGAGATPTALALHARAFDRLLEQLPDADSPNPADPWPSSRLREALAGLRWATTEPAGIATDPRSLPLDQYLV